MPVIGYLAAGSSKGDEQIAAALLKGLAETGYEDGKNIRIEYRWADNQYERLPSMATDLVRQKVVVIAATTTPAAKAAKQATTTIPIVFTTISDPVQMGFVASLSRPGGNVTGVTLLSVEVGPKLLELLRGAAPSATVMGLLVNPTNPNWRANYRPGRPFQHQERPACRAHSPSRDSGNRVGARVRHRGRLD